ncbi:ATPase synthesis protein 25, mitochondrial [[Candida] anglica]|uniref:ATPase synthesis protein 25 n=1 Tax=[Candida] anglica TaxID=148631 RepID=A0ABP0EGS6_9ASCO
MFKLIRKRVVPAGRINYRRGYGEVSNIKVVDGTDGVSTSTSAPTTSTTDSTPTTINTDTTSDLETPWYLRNDTASPLNQTFDEPLPEIPENSPQSITPFLELLSKKFGLIDLKLFDLTNQPEHQDSVADYMIVCTGKSEKHIYKAANELRMYIKHNHGIVPKLEGFVTNAAKNANYRRMLRRARKGPMATDNEYGTPANSWIMCDTDVDGICIHILTADRRLELNLESLWDGSVDPENREFTSIRSAPKNNLTNDDLFIGIRREYHTRAKVMPSLFLSKRSYSTQTISTVQSFLSEPMPITSTTIQSYIKAANKSPLTSINDYDQNYELVRAIHLVSPESISFQQVTEALLAKYTNLDIMLDKSIPIKELKLNDVMEFMKLLIDSPELQSNPENLMSRSDDLYHRLSQFVASLYRFSNDIIDINASPEFIPLLLRLSVGNANDSTLVGPGTLDAIMSGKQELSQQPPSSERSVLASNRMRGILDLIEYYNQQQQSSSPSVSELVLFLYGNAGKWEKFWDQWDVSFNVLVGHPHPADAVRKWSRLIVYLSISGDVPAQLYFFNTYWNRASSAAGSFEEAFRLNNKSFNSEEEQKCVKNALQLILRNLGHQKSERLNHQIEQFIREL